MATLTQNQSPITTTTTTTTSIKVVRNLFRNQIFPGLLWTTHIETNQFTAAAVVVFVVVIIIIIIIVIVIAIIIVIIIIIIIFFFFVVVVIIITFIIGVNLIGWQLVNSKRLIDWLPPIGWFRLIEVWFTPLQDYTLIPHLQLVLSIQKAVWRHRVCFKPDI